VPAHEKHTVAEDLMARLRVAVDEAADAARSLWGAFEILEDLVRHRMQLSQAHETLRGIDPALRDRVLREAQLSYIRHERSITEGGRADLVRAWTSLLIEATEKVTRDRADAEKYAAVAGQGPSEDDRDWADATAALLGRDDARN
jgi:hypothetical protein